MELQPFTPPLAVIEAAVAAPDSQSALVALVAAITDPLRTDARRSRYHKIVAAVGSVLSKVPLDRVITVVAELHRSLPNSQDVEVAVGVVVRAWTASRDGSLAGTGGSIGGVITRSLRRATELLRLGATAAMTAAAAFDAVRELTASLVAGGGDASAWEADAEVASAVTPLEAATTAFVLTTMRRDEGDDPHLPSSLLRVVRAALAARRAALAVQPGVVWAAFPEACVEGLVREGISHASWMLAEEAAIEVRESSAGVFWEEIDALSRYTPTFQLSPSPSARAAALTLILSEADHRGRFATTSRMQRLLRAPPSALSRGGGAPSRDLSRSVQPHPATIVADVATLLSQVRLEFYRLSPLAVFSHALYCNDAAHHRRDGPLFGGRRSAGTSDC